MPAVSDSDAARAELRDILRQIRSEFEGAYGAELNQLLALSKAEIDAITPGTTDLETYSALIEVVKDASRRNLAQAELRARIRDLGTVAVAIAGRVAGLARLVA